MTKFLAIICLSTTIVVMSCSHKEEHHENKTKFLVTSPLKMDTSVVQEYVCQIQSIRHIELRAMEKGYLKEFFVDEGQFVKKGKVMFQVMTNLYEAELQKAQAEVNYAEIEYQNTKSLADKGVVAPNELALAKAKFDKAKAELSLARVHLSFTQIKAPFDGIMDRLRVREGSLIDEGDLLSTLSDNHKMWVYFNVPEAQYLDYKTNFKSDSIMEVRLKMANDKVFDQIGRVEAIEADFNNETGNIAFRATFDNKDGLLRHGETGTILVTEFMKDALIIPQKATFEVLDKKYVYVVDKDDKIQSRIVEVAAEIPDLYVIESGITENDKILLEGLRIVHNLDEISYDFKKPVEVISHLQLHAE